MELSGVLTVAEGVARWLTVNGIMALVMVAFIRLQLALIKRTYGSWLLLSTLKPLLLSGYFALGLILDPLILVGFWVLIGLPIVSAKLWRLVRWSIEEIGHMREARVAQ